MQLFSRICHPAFEFHSLQKGEPAESELIAAHRSLGLQPVIKDWSEDLKDFSDTVALIEALDLVISVDISTAHLAGALGKPVWILLSFDGDWRWLCDRKDSPWYPTARIYRQPRRGDWASVIEELRAALVGEAA